MPVDEREESDGRLRPLDPFQDLDPVVELIDLAFGDKLDPVARATLARMRRFAQGGVLIQWLWALWGMVAISPGLVWVEGGRIVGNVSIRRARHRGGYLIGNVVVHPDWRRRGIATALMEAALRVISDAGGRWVGLEVRADNAGARRLYTELEFSQVGSTLHQLRPEGLPYGRPPGQDHTRRATSRDSHGLVDLVRAVIPEDQRPLLEIHEADYRPRWARRLRFWLRCEGEQWWVSEGREGLAGAVRVVRGRPAFPNRLEVLVRPGDEGLARTLVRRGVASLTGSPEKPIATALPAGLDRVATALQEQGFHRTHTLVQMKRTLSRRIPVRSREPRGPDEGETQQGSGVAGGLASCACGRGPRGWINGRPPSLN